MKNKPIINTRVLMSGAESFSNKEAINAHMSGEIQIDIEKAAMEHAAIRTAFEMAGIEVTKVPSPKGAQDGVYTANWALVDGGKAVMSNLPPARQIEEPYAERQLAALGYEIIKLPKGLRFSGQGDALPCGDRIFVGSKYRTSPEVHPLLADITGKEVVSLETVPALDENNRAITNYSSGWPDSFFYDLDLALAVITPELIAWCPSAFTTESVAKIRAIDDLEKIEVSLEEAKEGFGCNLVSTGSSVIMSNRAPELRRELEGRGLQVLAPDVTELLKGGGFIRCVSLTL